MPERDVAAELREAVDRVLESPSRKKLVVAGPGAGKTTLFKGLLEGADGEPTDRLVLTFINALKGDLDRNLGDLSQVFTLHGYCQHLLRRYATLRDGLTANFRCYPGLVSLIKADWQWLQRSDAPKFVELMRHLECPDAEKSFYRQRANYYDAVDFDDSVHRTYEQLAGHKDSIPDYTLVLIDEFQDFNKMEASVIDLLAERNAIVIAGDDDQALYSQLRGASWDHIRGHYLSGHYDIFELPFCMRCPKVIVDAANDIVAKAREVRNLDGRIEKAFRYCEPVKGEDSRLYPHIDLVQASVQRGNANYFGRYIEERITAITEEELKLAAERNEPAALIIGSNPYRRQVEGHLMQVGLLAQGGSDDLSTREEALRILSEDANSNLGWRIFLTCGDQGKARNIVRKAAEESTALAEHIVLAEREAILAEARAWAAEHEGNEDAGEETAPSVVVTSYEGSKGRSGQYVFLIGVHSGELPGDARNIKDIEICRFLVGLTRTKKKCSILIAGNAMGKFKRPSEFLGWIKPDRFQRKLVNAAHWAAHR